MIRKIDDEKISVNVHAKVYLFWSLFERTIAGVPLRSNGTAVYCENTTTYTLPY